MSDRGDGWSHSVVGRRIRLTFQRYPDCGTDFVTCYSSSSSIDLPFVQISIFADVDPCGKLVPVIVFNEIDLMIISRRGAGTLLVAEQSVPLVQKVRSRIHSSSSCWGISPCWFSLG